jgi:hypothetical protein
VTSESMVAQNLYFCGLDEFSRSSREAPNAGYITVSKSLYSSKSPENPIDNPLATLVAKHKELEE